MAPDVLRIAELVYALGMDQLDKEIVAKRKELDDLKRKSEICEFELRMLEKAAKLRPALPAQTASVEAPAQDGTRRGGRQPGSISVKWREALLAWAKDGNKPLDIDGIYLLTRPILGLTHASVRERIRQYQSQSIIEVAADGKFTVSDWAIKRFENGGNHKENRPHLTQQERP